jgi:hypothetical protein
MHARLPDHSIGEESGVLQVPQFDAEFPSASAATNAGIGGVDARGLVCPRPRAGRPPRRSAASGLGPSQRTPAALAAGNLATPPLPHGNLSSPAKRATMILLVLVL